MVSPAVNYRTFVIANPVAGAGSVREEWRLIERLLRANLPELDYAFTEGPGHATLLAREALRAGWEMIVAVGGDGTLNEVVNGFYENPEPGKCFQYGADGWITSGDNEPVPINPDAVLGLLPLGTGGDFRRTLGFMGGVAETVEHLRGRQSRAIDIGQIAFMDHKNRPACRYFINISAAGMSGAVDHYVNSSWKGLGGSASFIWGTLRAFVNWKNVEVDILIDGTTEVHDHVNNVIAANGEYFGAGMWIAPGAGIDDGSLQVVIMGDLTRAETVRILPKIYNGTFLASRKVTRYRASEVAVRPCNSDKPVLIDVDGEQPGQLPALWKIHPGVLKFKI